MKLHTVSGAAFEVSEESVPKIIAYTWYHNKRDNTISTVIDGVTVYLHRFLLNTPLQVDHIDRNPLNNRLDNLRPATYSQNQLNKTQYSNNTSGYKGVYWDKSVSKWCAKIRIPNIGGGTGRLKHIGFFSTPERAAVAYNEYARLYHKEFAYQNEVTTS